MAKKKDVEIDKFDITANLIKQYGNIIRPASEILDEELEVYSSGSPNLDIALGGGWTESSCIQLSGPPKCGKTTTLVSSMKSWHDKGRETFWLDSEVRFKKMNLRVRGLDPSKIILISSTEDKILDAVDSLTIVENIMKAKKKIAIVIDSVSALCPRERSGEEVNAQVRSTAAKLFSDFCKRNAAIVRVNKISLFMTIHTICNISGYGAPFLEDSGRKLEYFADTKIRANSFSKWLDGDKMIGVIPKWNILCSHIGRPSNNPVESYIRFDTGIDEIREWYGLGLDYSLLTKAGSWIEFSFLENPIKKQGESQCVEYLEENPKVLQSLKTEIQKLLA